MTGKHQSMCRSLTGWCSDIVLQVVNMLFVTDSAGSVDVHGAVYF